jgi:hypothetical protein
MNANTHNQHDDLPIEWVEEQLRALAAVEPPESLKDKLGAGIGAAAPAKQKDRYLGLWSWELRWASAAAAVVLLASIIGWLRSPPGQQAQPAARATDSTGWAQAVDHNSLRAADTNFCDTNSIR